MKSCLPVFILLMMLVFSSCDDGDIKVEEINFEDAVAARCGNLVYKIRDNEVLLIEIPAAETAFLNDPTPGGQPRTFTITGDTRVIYRSYSSEVSAESFCGSIPPAQPVVSEQWTALSGTIEVTTVQETVPNTSAGFEGGQTIARYSHNIVLRNLVFEKPGGTQLYETFVFGPYKTTPSTLTFGFQETLQKCPAQDKVFKFVSTEAISLTLDPTLNMFANQVTAQPRVANLGSAGSLVYYQFTGGAALTADYFCTTPAPATPAATAIWNGAASTSAETGRIEVTTIESASNPGEFIHTIRLKNVTLTKGNSSFLLASDFLLGTVITTQ